MVSTVKIVDPKYLGDELKNQQVRGRLMRRPWNFAKICYNFHPRSQCLDWLTKTVHLLYLRAVFRKVGNIPKI